MMNSNSSSRNEDQQEVAKFNNLADQWWDPKGAFKPLHDLNPLRLSFIQQFCELESLECLDVGCGGGILSESLAIEKARVTGLDLAKDSLEVAKSHATSQGLNIQYIECDVESFADLHPEQFDVVTCMELLEHVPDPKSIVTACSKAVKPGGHVFFSTLNRHPKAYLFAILGAEYLLNILPKGTHDYQKFIRPSELSGWARESGLQWSDITGITYNPITQHCSFIKDINVNYIVHCQKIA